METKGINIDGGDYRTNLAHDLRNLRQRYKTGRSLAETLLNDEKSNGEYLEHLPKGRIAPREMANNLMENGYFDVVAKNIGKFDKNDQDDIIKRLIRKGSKGRIATYLIDNGHFTAVAKNIEKFDKNYQDGIIRYLIRKGLEWDSVTSKSDFLDKVVAEMLIKKGYGRMVAMHIERFPENTHNSIAKLLIQKGLIYYVTYDLAHFKLLGEYVAKKIIEEGSLRSLNKFADYLGNFKGLGIEIAKVLIRKGKGNRVAGDIESFKKKDHKEIAKELLEYGVVTPLMEKINDFWGLNHNDVVTTLNEKKFGEYFARFLPKLKVNNHKKIAQDLMDSGQGGVVVDYFGNFKGLDPIMTVKELVEKGYGREVALKIENFGHLDENIAQLLINNGYGWCVILHPSIFAPLSKKTAEYFLQQEYTGVKAFGNNRESFKGIDDEILSLLKSSKNEEMLVCYFLEKFLKRKFDDNRKAAMKSDGTYECKMEESKDEQWNKQHKTNMVDIVNTEFDDLPFNWKHEKAEVARYAVYSVFADMVKGREITPEMIEEMSKEMHEKWLERNGWVYDEKKGNYALAQPYETLPEKEKEKYRGYIYTAIEVIGEEEFLLKRK